MKTNALAQTSALPLVLAVALSNAVGVSSANAASSDPAGITNGGGLAANYRNDAGIARDTAVIFADDFEAWKREGGEPARWQLRRNNISQTRAVPGNVEMAGAAGSGSNVVEIACWTQGSGSQVGGLSLRLGNYNHRDEGLGDGYDEIYARYYLKFDADYRGVRNHGANLGGRDLTRADAAWVGMAAVRDVSTRGYFYSGLQPYGKEDAAEMEMGFYSYHLDKRGPWGENYDALKHVPIQVGKWYCVERHLKLNSVDLAKADPANADGIEELWVDGELTIRKEGVRFRRVPHLCITMFSLETYYHGLPARYDHEHPIRVYFDNVVIATNYIGPLNRIGGSADSAGGNDDSAMRRRLAGTWRGFAVEGTGERPDRGPVKLEVTISETEISAIKDGQQDMGAGAYTLDLTQSPAWLEGTRTRGPGPKGPYLGIFQLEGNGDTLKWCMANPRYPRPTEFRTVKGQFLLILKRAQE